MVRDSFLVRLMAAILFLWAVEKVGGVSILRCGCGQSKLCIEEPKSCDPSPSSGSCLFSSIESTSTQFNFSLRGETEGYVALGLSNSTDNQGKSILFICTRNGSRVFFRTVEKNNSTPSGPFTNLQLTVENFSGEVEGSVTRCTFSFPLSNITRLNTNHDTVFTVLLGTGPVNGSSLGVFNISKRAGPLDLVNFEKDAFTSVTHPTATPTTTRTTPTTTTTMGSISHSGCGQSKLCVRSPVSCDPSSCSCLFSSIESTSTQFNFSLRGETEGYVALGLTSINTQEISKFFVCGKTYDSFFFMTAQRNNSLQNATLTITNTSVSEIRGEAEGNVTSCLFKVQRDDLKTRSSDSEFEVILGTGPVSGTALGLLNVVLKTGFLDVTKANAVGRAVCPLTLLSALILPILLTLALIK